MNKLNTLLSENMLRFGTKNLSGAQQKQLIVKSIMETIKQNGLSYEIRKQLIEQNLLTEATLKDLDSAGMASAQKFFAAAIDKSINGPQFATANLMYRTDIQNIQADEGIAKYTMSIYRLESINYGVAHFIIPAFYGNLDYTTNYGLQEASELGLGTALDATTNAETTVAAAADQINYVYNDYAMITPQTVTTHFNARKAKLATAIATTKAAQNFATLGTLLNGTAKTVYDLIAAS
jgi:hypothetical protein